MRKNTLRHQLAIVATVLILTRLPAPAASGGSPSQSERAPDAPVVITDAGNTVTLENGRISVKINKTNGDILELRFKAMNLFGGLGYWNIFGEIPGQAMTKGTTPRSTLTTTQDPARDGGEIGEIEISFPYNGQAGAEPLDIAIRYTLRRGDSALYCWTSVNHQPDYPAFNMEISNLVMKLNPEIFDHLTVDSRRDRQMITGYDWVHGQPLNLKEARQMTTGIRAGQVEHKYDYSAMFSETPAYGWTSTSRNVGLWVVNPSLEYINGSPTKIELTGHIDVKDVLPADPVLLFVWHGSHYGGVPIQINAGERWSKVIGPFLIYCNSGPGPDEMWKDALARADAEKQEWPYAWAKAPGYAGAEERGAVSGRLVVLDPQQTSASAAGAWVGLAAAPYAGIDLKRKPFTITWETDGKHYEYWTRADKAGAFTIRNARPGKYVLYAFNDGILGEFSRADVSVDARKTLNIGTLSWTPVRYGRQVWEIGIPNRSAEEFRHGDHYWEWGLYNLYPDEFPSDVNFVIGKSDWKRDWNYAQPPRMGADGRWHGTTWRITFDLPKLPPGMATLRLAICGARDSRVDVAANGRSIGTTGDLPSSGVMHRDGIRGTEFECALPFDTALLVDGKNFIDLSTRATTWYDGVLYDYLRLEIDDASEVAR